MNEISKFFCLTSLVALIISFIGIIIFLRNMIFCIKRYILHFRGVNTELSTFVFDTDVETKELSPPEIVRKTLLKEQIEKFARDTANTVKGNEYLSERKEDVVDSTFQSDMKKLSMIYIMLDKMKISTPEELDEVDFLFNKGKLRSDSEIKEFYKNKELKAKQSNYKDSGFLSDLITAYTESNLSVKLITGLSLMFVSFMYFIYKIHFETSPSLKWNYLDIVYFIGYILQVVFSPYYSHTHDMSDYNGTQLFFTLSLLASIPISFIIGMGSILIVQWTSNIELHKIYSKAGEKKKPDILLGVNTASYLYLLHKLLKKRK